MFTDEVFPPVGLAEGVVGIYRGKMLPFNAARAYVSY
jgi:hypothetical protein